MSIHRNLLNKTAKLLGAMACFVGLSFASVSCVSPDLEPPGVMGATNFPNNSAATQHGANAGAQAAATPPTGPSTAATTTAPAAGQPAKPAGTTAPAQTQPTTTAPPPVTAGAAGTSGAAAGAGATIDPNADGADAGTP